MVLPYVNQGRRKHLKLEGQDTSRALSKKKKGVFFLEIKRARLCLLQNLWGHVPPMPPGSYV